MIKNHLILIMI